MKTIAALIITAALAGATAPAMGAPGTAHAAAPTVTVRSSDYGPILFDGAGRALYAFTRDARGRSRCSGDCARAWPPYVVRSGLRAGPGTRAGLLGTVRRADGSRQVTYAGWPLYYYVGDDAPGVVRCQNVVEFGGTWLVQRAGGRLVR